MIPTVEKNDVSPLCPYCSEPIESVWMRVLRSTLGKMYIYFCPACHKTLGVSNRKGFWMG
jgi:hypothetical protein